MPITCSACGAKMTLKALNTPHIGLGGTKLGQVHECPKCGAVQGSCYKGQGYSVVASHLPMVPNAADAVFFDLELLGSAGIERIHGWMDKATRRVVQWG